MKVFNTANDEMKGIVEEVPYLSSLQAQPIALSEDLLRLSFAQPPPCFFDVMHEGVVLVQQQSQPFVNRLKDIKVPKGDLTRVQKGQLLPSVVFE